MTLTSRQESLLSFAIANNLSPAVTAALPAAISCGAKLVNVSESEFLWQLHNNAKLAEYIIKTCQEAIDTLDAKRSERDQKEASKIYAGMERRDQDRRRTIEHINHPDRRRGERRT